MGDIAVSTPTPKATPEETPHLMGAIAIPTPKQTPKATPNDGAMVGRMVPLKSSQNKN
jgi:hypothetical protein